MQLATRFMYSSRSFGTESFFSVAQPKITKMAIAAMAIDLIAIRFYLILLAKSIPCAVGLLALLVFDVWQFRDGDHRPKGLIRKQEEI